MIFPVSFLLNYIFFVPFQGCSGDYGNLINTACETLKLGNAVNFQTGSGPFSLVVAPNMMYGYVEVTLKTSGTGFQGKQKDK
jgi:hypothetical protein